MAYLVREPVLADVSELGAVDVRAWQTAYRGGLMPDEYLDSLSADDRADAWRRGLEADPRPRHHRYVVDDGTGAPVGFIVVGPADGAPEGGQGEVYSVNVDPDHWGKGAGTLLLEQGVTALTEDGFPTAVLWVHPGNERACRFYEARGWELEEAERIQEVWGIRVPEVRYRRPLL